MVFVLAGLSNLKMSFTFVMAGLDPAIHVFLLLHR